MGRWNSQLKKRTRYPSGDVTQAAGWELAAQAPRRTVLGKQFMAKGDGTAVGSLPLSWPRLSRCEMMGSLVSEGPFRAGMRQSVHIYLHGAMGVGWDVKPGREDPERTSSWSEGPESEAHLCNRRCCSQKGAARDGVEGELAQRKQGLWEGQEGPPARSLITRS